VARSRADRRAEMLRTAARMFADSGFHGVSIDDLGAELGVSGPAIYRYFPGKEAILAEMLVDISQRLLDGARERVAAESTALARLGALIDFHIAFATGEPDLIAVQYRDLGNAPDPERRRVRALQRQYVDVWVTTLREVYPASPHERARTSAQAVFGMLNSTPYTRGADEPGHARVLAAMAAAALAAGCASP